MTTSIVFCPTKAGHGFKICVGDAWFYTSKRELYAVLQNRAAGCYFRPIHDITPLEQDKPKETQVSTDSTAHPVERSVSSFSLSKNKCTSLSAASTSGHTIPTCSLVSTTQVTR